MMKNILFKAKLLILTCFLVVLSTNAKENTFVSVSPSMTEIVYVLNAQSSLLAVSDNCSYPKETKNKEKIGSGYLLNEEKIIKLKPDYILAFDSSLPQLEKFKKFGIIPLCFKYPNVESVFENIKKIAKYVNKTDTAEDVVNRLQNKIEQANKHQNKKILYIVQTSPFMTIGAQSFISDVIKKSGNRSATDGVKSSYPVISEEYIIKQKPDVIVITPYAEEKKVKKFFPNTKIVKLTQEQNDIINRPGPRIYLAVEFFASL